jgi:hypothetical protein
MLNCSHSPVERIYGPAGFPKPRRGGTVEAHEIAEKINEDAEAKSEAPASHDWFRRLTAIYVGVVAMLLAIASLGGASATKEMLDANIHASDTYAFYQSKYIRQNDYQIAVEQLELLATGLPGLTAEQRAKVDQLVRQYRDRADRYESDPKTREGKKELIEKAKKWEEIRDHAATQSPNFEYSEALLQIAIVLGSVAIVATSLPLLGVSAVLAAAGLLLTINGYLLVIPLGHG